MKQKEELKRLLFFADGEADGRTKYTCGYATSSIELLPLTNELTKAKFEGRMNAGRCSAPRTRKRVPGSRSIDRMNETENEIDGNEGSLWE